MIGLMQGKPAKAVGKRFLECRYYEDCLDLAALRNWKAYNCDSCYIHKTIGIISKATPIQQSQKSWRTQGSVSSAVRIQQFSRTALYTRAASGSAHGRIKTVPGTKRKRVIIRRCLGRKRAPKADGELMMIDIRCLPDIASIGGYKPLFCQ